MTAENNHLAGAVLGMLDQLPARRIDDIIGHRIKTPTTVVRTVDLYAMFDALETEYPGLLSQLAGCRPVTAAPLDVRPRRSRRTRPR